MSSVLVLHEHPPEDDILTHNLVIHVFLINCMNFLTHTSATKFLKSYLRFINVFNPNSLFLLPQFSIVILTVICDPTGENTIDVS